MTLTGRAAEFERLVELLRNATVSTRLTPETVTQLRDARIKVMRDVSLAPETIADRAITARLYGSYPYGRLMTGSPESLARIDRTDLMLARERFLNPNNATLVCIGGVEPARALRAMRQFLGVWRRSERVIPATFRQPEKPGQPMLIVNLAGAPDVEARLALRGVARTDRDAAAAAVLPLLVRDRWRALAPQLKESVLSVRHDAYAIGGVFRMSAAVRSSGSTATAFESARKTLDEFVTTPPTPAALENAKRETLAALSQNVVQTEAIAEGWLDAQTYNSETVSTPELTRAINSLTPADIQRIAARLFRDAPLAMVAVGDEAKLRSDLARSGSLEVLGAASDPKTQPPAPTAPRAPSTPGLRMRRP
ncbi:MAG: insulinase family protein [Acidobacteriota bacterium]|nr:insulinase family protein [Acidobacteriota bacterium]